MENTFEILASRFRVLLGTMEQGLKVVRDIVLTCVMLYNMLRTHQGGLDRVPTPADDIVSIVKEQVVHVSGENLQELFEGGKASSTPTEGLLQSCWCIGWAGQDLICEEKLPWGKKKLESISPFQDHTIIPRTL